MADVEAPRDVRQHLASLATRNRLSTLMDGQLRPASHDDASGHGTLPAFAGADTVQLTFELSQTAKDGQHEPSVRSSRVRPAIPQRLEARALLGNGAKDSLLAPVINAIGPWNAQDIAPKTLLGQFNSYVRAVILRVSETHDLGDVNRYTFYDASKVYCASPHDFLRVNQKHMQEFYVKNVCGVIFTSNYRDGLYLPEDDRRHDVLWSELVAADFADGYWTKLWSWYSDGGNEHVASYLMSRDISKFDPAAPPPKGPAFWAIVDSSAAPEDSEFGDLLDCITHDLVDMEDGGWPAAVTLSQVRRYADEPMKAWIDDRRNRRAVPHRFDKCGYVPVRNEVERKEIGSCRRSDR
jgi:hypothetical protein